MKKIAYVTGALGFIGSHVTRECLNKGWYVMGVDKITYAATPSLIDEFQAYGDHFSFIQSDINDMDRLYDVDVFINLAAESHVDNSISRSDEFLHSNVNGVHNLLELIRIKKERPLFFHFSTDETYGDISIGSHKETDLLKPSNPYSASKACSDHLIQAWHRTYGIPYIIVRPTNNYGCFQATEKLIPRVCKCLLTGHKIPLHNNGTPRRNWLNAKDTAKAVIKIIESEVTNEIYNISGNYEDSNINVVTKIINCYLNRDIYTVLSPEEIDKYIDFSYNRPGVDVRYSLDDSKLRKLGWEPKCIFDNELPSIIEYYKENFIW